MSEVNFLPVPRWDAESQEKGNAPLPTTSVYASSKYGRSPPSNWEIDGIFMEDQWDIIGDSWECIVGNLTD